MGYDPCGLLIGGKTMEPMEFEREQPKAEKILIDVLYCEVCIPA
jgi:uncharacterized zinc-type alcohol dehydrogenase-like protein